MALPEAERITYEAYKQLPDDGRRYEVIEGELFVTPSPTWKHQRACYWITQILGGWIESRGLGRLQFAPLDVILADDTIVQPDLVFIRRERLAGIVGDYVHGPPDLVIEILSPKTATRDRKTKRQAYARHGIPEYWMVDTEARSASVMVLEAGHYVELGSVTGDRVIPSRVLEGVPAKASDIFQD
jgi:Uma2 family endonuclease